MHRFFAIQLIFLFQAAVAQDTTVRFSLFDKEETSIDLWLGYHLQGNWSDETGETNMKYLEIGIGKGRYWYHRHGVAGSGFYLSEEILLNGNKQIYGTKLGYFAYSLAGAGLSVVYYTDFKKGNLKIRPELGFGMGRFALLVGYNIPTIRNKSFTELRRQNAQVSIRAGLGIVKKKLKFERGI